MSQPNDTSPSRKPKGGSPRSDALRAIELQNPGGRSLPKPRLRKDVLMPDDATARDPRKPLFGGVTAILIVVVFVAIGYYCGFSDATRSDTQPWSRLANRTMIRWMGVLRNQCSLDGKRWFNARPNGMCYTVDRPLFQPIYSGIAYQEGTK